MNYLWLSTISCLFIGLLNSLGSPAASSYAPGSVSPPAPMREFRAAWIATVANIDWPSTNTLSTKEQKAELIGLLDFAAKLGLNAVILQVRPACDAMYASRVEPWSEYLAGAMGRPPSPYYDPLALAVSEAHRRGLELHAWFNPYRALHPSAKSPVSPNHVSKTRPSLVRTYGKHLWLDPGEKAVQDYSLSVVMDVVKHYDVDGIHFDDYFYPYKELDASGKEIDFPDASAWKKYGMGKARDDWRRENVNTFIQRVNRSVKDAKPWVKFGVSPFGIWRPGNPPQIKGYDPYDKLYADARTWLMKGWVDYFAPQLYWAIDPPAQSFPALLNWWGEQNPQRRHLWPGMNTYNVGRKWKPEEIINQIQLTRKQGGATGHIHWNMTKGLVGNKALCDRLAAGLYGEPALVPASTWVKGAPLGKPRLSVSARDSGLRLTWAAGTGPKPSHWLLQTQSNGKWTTRVLPGQVLSQSVNGSPDQIALTAVDRYGYLSPVMGMVR